MLIILITEASRSLKHNIMLLKGFKIYATDISVQISRCPTEEEMMAPSSSENKLEFKIFVFHLHTQTLVIL